MSLYFKQLFCVAGMGLVISTIAILAGMAIPTVSQHGEQLHRINNGVSFVPRGRLSATGENWLHTFRVKLPEPVWRQVSVSCPGKMNDVSLDRKKCQNIGIFTSRLHEMQISAAAVLQQRLDSIYEIIPETKEAIQVERTRKALSFVADIGKSWFGFATNSDMTKAFRHINYLEKTQRNMTSVVIHLQDQYASVTTAVNHRFARAMKLFDTVQKEMDTLSHTLTRAIQVSYNTTARMLTVLMGKQQALYELQEAYLHLQLASEALVTGSLSPFFIPPGILMETLANITHIIRDTYPGFNIVHSQPHYYYNNPHYMFSRKADSIYITLKIPIASRQSMLTWYAIRTMPVPLNSTTTLATILNNMPDYFAVSADGQFHTTLTERDLLLCTGHALKHCPYELALKPVSQITCPYALYTDSTTLIADKCDFKVVAGLVRPKLQELAPGVILVTNTSRLILRCPEVPQKRVQGCNYCTLNLPCKCSLQSESHLISPRIMACNGTSSRVTRLYPINLPLLRAVYGQEAYDNIRGGDVWSRPTQARVPDFHVYRKTIEDGIAADKEASWDLEEATKRAMKNQLLYNSPSDQLYQQTLDDNNNTFTAKLIGLIVTMVVSLTILAVLFLAIYMRRINKALVATTMSSVLPNPLMDKAEAVQINPVLPTAPFTPTFMTYPAYHVDMTWSPTTFMLYLAVLLTSIATFMIGILLVRWLRAYFFTRWHSTFIIEISDGRECVQVQIFHLSDCPHNWHFSTPDTYITHVHIQGIFRPTIHFVWPGFQGYQLSTRTPLTGIPMIPLSFLAARKLRRLLADKWFVDAFILHGGIRYPLVFCRSECDAHHSSFPSIPYPLNNAGLYPQLPTAPQPRAPTMHVNELTQQTRV